MPEMSTKGEIIRALGIPRSSFYYRPRLPSKDWRLKQRIEAILRRRPSLGYREISRRLMANGKRVRRVMRKFGIQPYRRRPRKPRKKRDEGKAPASFPNLLVTIPFPDMPSAVWAQDFTYLPFKGTFVYLATVLDLCTREIVGWHVSTSRNAELVIGALAHAISRTGSIPQILHGDQGSEYTSKRYLSYVKSLGIRISMSRKSSPWENGYQESFFSHFKVDLGDPDRFSHLGELVAEIHRTIHLYNTDRHHSALKMTPSAYAESKRKSASSHHPKKTS
jgi:putative transposase